jgi:hypothetical protein
MNTDKTVPDKFLTTEEMRKAFFGTLSNEDIEGVSPHQIAKLFFVHPIHRLPKNCFDERHSAVAQRMNFLQLSAVDGDAAVASSRRITVADLTDACPNATPDPFDAMPITIMLANGLWEKIHQPTIEKTFTQLIKERKESILAYAAYSNSTEKIASIIRDKHPFVMTDIRLKIRAHHATKKGMTESLDPTPFLTKERETIRWSPCLFDMDKVPAEFLKETFDHSRYDLWRWTDAQLEKYRDFMLPSLKKGFPRNPEDVYSNIPLTIAANHYAEVREAARGWMNGKSTCYKNQIQTWLTQAAKLQLTNNSGKKKQTDEK